MSKAVGAIAVGIALVAVAVFVPGVGTAIAGAAFSASAAAGATLSAATLAAIQAGAATLIVATGLTIAANGLQMARAANAISQAQLTRLNVTLDPSAPRKIAFGYTALATDLRASIPTGTDQEYHEYIICVASHTVESITEIWFEDRQAWTVGGGIAAYYSGYLTTVTVRNPGTNANGIAINAQWPAASTLTGCAYVYLKVKRTGNSKKAESVLPQGIPSRVTIIGKGMKVYDPRLDSTVTGGSGTHRADDQTTWEYSHSGTDIGNNPALQILAYRLGWQINSKLAVGKGMLPERLDLPSFITAANICDEPVTLAIGGTQRRYETHAVFSENDATSSVENALLFACAGRMTDHNGKLGIALAYNDLTGTLYEFTDDDVLGAFDWNPSPSIHEMHNIIRGRWTDPSSNSLYQMVDYPAIRITSPDGIDRTLTIDLPVVQDGKRAQRIAKQILQREQYQGTFAAIFGIRAWGVKVGDPVKLTFDTLGFVEKLFRVVQQGIRSDGTVQLILREEATALYAWAAEESALVTVAAPTVYDQLNNPLAIINGVDIGVANYATRNAAQTYRVRTRGYSATLPGGDTHLGLWNEDTNTQIANVTPMYTVAVYIASGGNWISQVFDTLNNPTVVSTITGASMDARSAMGYYLAHYNNNFPGCPVVVFGYDEPSAGRTAGTPYQISTEMYRAGASRAVFGSAKFMFRNAYLLVGICGAGEGNGAEYLAGAGVASSPDAFIDVGFGMTAAGVLSISGRRPSDAADLVYVNGVTIEALKPSEAGADVTGSNTALNTANVGGLTTAQTLTAISDARAVADGAAADAQLGVTLTYDITDDNKLSKGAEKKALVAYMADAAIDMPKYYAQATALGLATEATNLYNGYGALTAYLAGLTPAWDSINSNTGIVRNTFRSAMAVYVDALAAVSNALHAKAASTATWATVSGAGRPADNADVTTHQPIVSNLNPATGIIINGQALNANNNFGLRSLIDAPTITDSVVSTLCYIDIAAFNVYPDWGGTITYPSGTIGPVSYATTYFIYRNVASAGSTGTSYGYSTLLSDALGTGRVYFGYITTRATSGSGGSSGGGTGGGGTEFCVAPEAWVGTPRDVTRGADVAAGDVLIILTDDRTGLATAEVESNVVGHNFVCTITTASGAALTLSVNTPVPSRTGGYVMAANAWLIDVPVLRGDVLTWEPVVSVVARGWQRVQQIRCHQQVYAAGDTPDALIMTHNPYHKP